MGIRLTATCVRDAEELPQLVACSEEMRRHRPQRGRLQMLGQLAEAKTVPWPEHHGGAAWLCSLAAPGRVIGASSSYCQTRDAPNSK